MEGIKTVKKGIKVYTDYDQDGRWRLNIKKQRGKLTLDEIREAAREWEYDYYLLVLDCYHDPDDCQLGDEPVEEWAQLYRTSLLYEEE